MSLRWLKPNPSLVISFIPIGLWQFKVLLGFGCMNCKVLFLKRGRLSKLLILLSRLFHSITEDRKNEFFDSEPRNVVDNISCSVCCPSGGDFIKEILRGLVFSDLKKIAKFSKPPPIVLRIPNLILDNVFP